MFSKIDYCVHFLLMMNIMKKCFHVLTATIEYNVNKGIIAMVGLITDYILSIESYYRT